MPKYFSALLPKRACIHDCGTLAADSEVQLARSSNRCTELWFSSRSCRPYLPPWRGREGPKIPCPPLQLNGLLMSAADISNSVSAAVRTGYCAGPLHPALPQHVWCMPLGRRD